MNFRLDYRRAFFVALYALLIALCALNFLRSDLKYERLTVARFEKWEQEDAEIIENQEAQIANLQEQLAAEKKAHADTQKTLVELTKSSFLPLSSETQHIRDLEARLKAYEQAYPKPANLHANGQQSIDAGSYRAWNGPKGKE